MNNIQNLRLIRKNIYNWFIKNREEYFFRQNRNPYRIWVSEVFLQQTRIQSAIGKLENFLKIFPDVESLAKAEEQDVLAAFKGMGYYNRARNLWKGAKFVASRPEGFPTDSDGLKKIPSVGEYTAAAIGSICFGHEVMVIDGNIKRIFARIFQIEIDIQRREFREQLNIIEKGMFSKPETRPGDINEALMEFGQKVCTPKSPECKQCIINRYCLAFKNQCVQTLPIIAKPSKNQSIDWKIFFIVRNNEVLLQKYDNFYFLKNQYGFPSVLEIRDSGVISNSMGFANNEFQKNPDFIQGPAHTITNHKIRFYYQVIDSKKLDLNMEIERKDFLWVPITSVENHIISSGLQKTWDMYLKTIDC